MKEKLFARSEHLVKLLGEVMSDVHEDHTGKENSTLRENILEPH